MSLRGWSIKDADSEESQSSKTKRRRKDKKAGKDEPRDEGTDSVPFEEIKDDDLPY